MTSEIYNIDLDNWLEKVSAYCSGKDKKHGEIGELKHFLLRLQENLSVSVSDSVSTTTTTNLKLTDVVKKFPKVGLLLGRLCDNNSLLLDGDVYELVMQCVLLLYTGNPSNVIEQKATSWARTQIRTTVSYYKQEDPCSNLAESIGCIPDQFNTESCQKLIKKITEGLQHQDASWESKNGFVLPCRELLAETMRQLSLQCLALFKVPSANRVIEAFVSCHECASITEPLHPAFLDAVIQSQQYAYSDESCDIPLSYQCQTKLWKRYLPALEEEVINLVRALFNRQPWLPREEAVKLINSRYLPQACLQDHSIYRAMAGILQAFIENTQGNYGILNIVDYFHQALIVKSSAADTSQSRTLSGICSLYPLSLRSLVNLLILSPQGLTFKGCCLHLTNLDNILQEILNTLTSSFQDMHQLWMVLISWPTWYYKAIEVLVKGDWSHRPPGMMLMCLFNYPLHPDKHDLLKEKLISLAGTLRQLVSQSPCDIKVLRDTSLSLANQNPVAGQVTNALQVMCHVCVMNSQHALQHIQEVMTIALLNDAATNPTCQLRFLLDSIELHQHLNGSLPHTADESSDHKALMLKHLQDLRQRCLSDTSDDPSGVKETDRMLQCCIDSEHYLHYMIT